MNILLKSHIIIGRNSPNQKIGIIFRKVIKTATSYYPQKQLFDYQTIVFIHNS